VGRAGGISRRHSRRCFTKDCKAENPRPGPSSLACGSPAARACEALDTRLTGDTSSASHCVVRSCSYGFRDGGCGGHQHSIADPPGPGAHPVQDSERSGGARAGAGPTRPVHLHRQPAAPLVRELLACQPFRRAEFPRNRKQALTEENLNLQLRLSKAEASPLPHHRAAPCTPDRSLVRRDANASANGDGEFSLLFAVPRPAGRTSFLPVEDAPGETRAGLSAAERADALLAATRENHRLRGQLSARAEVRRAAPPPRRRGSARQPLLHPPTLPPSQRATAL
jgi:hypothetical protein